MLALGNRRTTIQLRGLRPRHNRYRNPCRYVDDDLFDFDSMAGGSTVLFQLIQIRQPLLGSPSATRRLPSGATVARLTAFFVTVILNRCACCRSSAASGRLLIVLGTSRRTGAAARWPEAGARAPRPDWWASAAGVLASANGTTSFTVVVFAGPCRPAATTAGNAAHPPGTASRQFELLPPLRFSSCYDGVALMRHH